MSLYLTAYYGFIKPIMRSPCLWDYTVCYYGKITKKECAIDVSYYDINSNENEICM